MGVATAVAIGGLALSAGTTAMSFVQAGEQKQNKEMQKHLRHQQWLRQEKNLK